MMLLLTEISEITTHPQTPAEEGGYLFETITVPVTACAGIRG
ncbi:MAG: hypothetical protein WAU28_04375 [Candidatus Moraniibacteriota bacterium]